MYKFIFAFLMTSTLAFAANIQKDNEEKWERYLIDNAATKTLQIKLQKKMSTHDVCDKYSIATYLHNQKLIDSDFEPNMVSYLIHTVISENKVICATGPKREITIESPWITLELNKDVWRGGSTYLTDIFIPEGYEIIIKNEPKKDVK